MPPAEYATHCRAHGVAGALLIEDPDPCRVAFTALPDFIIPLPWVDIDKVTVKEIHDCFDWGAKGIKFIDPQFSYGDTRYDPLYRAILERGGVCMFHTGYLSGVAIKSRPTDITLMRPAAVDCMARRFPKLSILMAHFGNPWWEEAWKITWSNRNVYSELSGGTARRRSMRMWEDIFCPNGNLDTATLNRLLYATDVEIFEAPGKEGFDLYFEFYDQLFDVIKAPEELREKINRGTAIELFKLR